MSGSLTRGLRALGTALGAGLLLALAGCGVIQDAGAPPVRPVAPIQADRVPTARPTPVPLSRPASAQASPAQVGTSDQGVTAGSGPASNIGETAAAGPWTPPATSTVQPAPGPAAVSFTPAGGDLQYYISGFACTGSMRPTLDCGDEARFVRPPFPRSLEVGDVISFLPDVSCRYYKFQEISKAHRVIAIRMEGGIPHYTTKGDASVNPDPCEVTLDQINGLLVGVRKGVRPQDIIDTSEYEVAKQRVQELKSDYARLAALYDQKKAIYDSGVAEYEALAEEFHAGNSSYEAVSEALRKLEEQRAVLNALADQVNALTDETNNAIEEVDRIYQELFAN